MQEALLGERGKLLEALQREEAHAAAVAAACSGAGASADPAEGDPGADPAAPADARPPAGDDAPGTMLVDGTAVEGAAEQGGGAAGGSAGPAADDDADELDAYMSSVRTQIELDKARPASASHTPNLTLTFTPKTRCAHADRADQGAHGQTRKAGRSLCIRLPL